MLNSLCTILSTTYQEHNPDILSLIGGDTHWNTEREREVYRSIAVHRSQTVSTAFAILGGEVDSFAHTTTGVRHDS